MIRVARGEPPAELEAAADKELGEVLALYEGPTPFETFKFKAYKVPAVAEELGRIFHGKCAYCESSMAAVMPKDIDHYRPKGAILICGSLSSPGYYWLAAAWENLLPSCIFCNRPNRHALPRSELRGTRGKSNQFPLADEATRARKSHQDWHAEQPLLIDPCGVDDPRMHLRFKSDGWVEPRVLADGTPSAKGTATIDILALLRPDLIARRRRHAMWVLGDLGLILSLSPRVATDPHARTEQAQRLVHFAHYLEPEEEYLALTMDIVEEVEPDFMSYWPSVLRAAKAHSGL